MTLTGLSFLCSCSLLFVEILLEFFCSCEKSLVEAGWALCCDCSEVFTPSNLSWEWAPTLWASCQGSYLLCSRALFWCLAIPLLLKHVVFSGSHGDTQLWVAGTCPTKSSGNWDELLGAGFISLETPMLRGVVWVYRQLGNCDVWQQEYCILHSSVVCGAGNSSCHTALQLSSVAGNKC